MHLEKCFGRLIQVKSDDVAKLRSETIYRNVAIYIVKLQGRSNKHALILIVILKERERER